MPFATVRIDGALALHSLRVLNTNTPGMESDAPLFFMVHGGVQDHPVWAYDRLAIVVFSYVHVARQTTGDLSGLLEVSMTGQLISAGDCSSVLAKSIQWHTASSIRRVAERLIEGFVSGGMTPEKLGIRVPMAEQNPPDIVTEEAAKRQKNSRSEKRI